ncbi:MAG: lamin tail domain-containing protein, partial [Flavobacteriales bacterium]
MKKPDPIRSIFRTACALLALLALLPRPALAQLEVAALNTAYTITFDATVAGVNNGAFTGSGFAPSPASGQLNSNAWASTGMSDGASAFGGTNTSGDFARGTSTGGVTSGGFYAFEVGPSDHALGVQPTGSDWEPGTLTLRVQNNSGTTLTSLDLAYELWVRNDQGRSNTFNISWSSDNLTYTPISALDFASPLALDAFGFVLNNKSTTIPSMSIANGGYVYLRWSSAGNGGSGSRDEFALDDISVTGHGAGGSNTSVEFASTASFAAEGSAPVDLALSITNPDAVNATSVTISATDPNGRITSFTTPVNFAGDSSADENVTVTIDDNAICDGDEDVTFTITGISGGQGTAFIGGNDTYTLTVTDNDALSVPVAIAASAINSNDFTANWNASAGATGYELDVYTQGPLPASELFFSEYVEGTSSNKYLEIYNGTGASVDLAHYTVKLFTNGNTSPTSTNILSGTLNDDEVIVLKNSSATIYGGAATNATACGFNGNDAVLLLNNVTGDTLDIIGRIGEDPGTAWTGSAGRTTLDGTLVRNAGVTGGITANPAAGFPSLDSEWSPLGTNDVSGLGSHTYSGMGEVMVSGSPFILGNVTSYSVTGLTPSTDYYYRVRATGGGCPATANSNVIMVTTTVGITPFLIAGTLADFGDICLNADGGPFSFTLDGTNLTAADVTVAALSGYTFSTTELGAYTTTLSISQPGGTFSQDIWVKFTPTLEQNYDGDITVGGGGASDITVAATGDGINTAAIMATGGIVSVGMNQAEVGGSVTDVGCSALTDYGIEYSTTNGFTPGTGTQVSSTNLSGGNYSSTITGLDPCTIYYYVAYGTNGGGTTYGTEDSFETAPIGAPVATAPVTVNMNDFTATWDATASATGYRLDVSTSPTFGTTVTASELFISEYVEGGGNNKYIELYNGTGASVDLSNYSLHLFNNGGTSANSTEALSGTLANGGTIVYANSSAVAYGGSVTTTSICNFNGDDALLLLNTTTGDTLDIIGTIGEDPGSAWSGSGGRSTANKTLVRRPDVTGGVTANPATGFPTLDSEWDVYAQDDVSFLGAHDFNTIDPYYLPGYEDLAVSGTSQSVTGLNASTTYYYRVRAENISCSSNNSNTIAVTTLACPGNAFVVAINTDGNGDQTSWAILDENNNYVAFGGPYTGQNNTLITESICIGVAPVNACYQFHLYDSFGDGLSGVGNWQLRASDGRVLLGDDFTTGYESPASPPANPNYGSNHSFCLPPGPANIAPTECGIFNNMLGNKVYANKVTGASNYQFEFSDPDAGFMRRIARPYNYVHFWDMVTNPLVPGVKYFARVRTDRDGPMQQAHFGSGCEMGISLPTVVTCTQLIQAPAYGHS